MDLASKAELWTAVAPSTWNVAKIRMCHVYMPAFDGKMWNSYKNFVKFWLWNANLDICLELILMEYLICFCLFANIPKFMGKFVACIGLSIYQDELMVTSLHVPGGGSRELR